MVNNLGIIPTLIPDEINLFPKPSILFELLDELFTIDLNIHNDFLSLFTLFK